MTWDKVLSYPRSGVSCTSFGIHSTPFPFHFLVHLQFNLLSWLQAIFATSIAAEMISQMIECYQFSCHFAVPEKKSWSPKGVDKTHLWLSQHFEILLNYYLSKVNINYECKDHRCEQ